MEASRKANTSGYLRFVVLIAIFIAGYWWMSRPVETAVIWKTNFDEAVAEAKEKKLPLFVDFYANWCGPCQMLDARVLSSQEVARVMHERFVPVRVDLSNRNTDSPAERVADEYGIRALPTLLVVDPHTRRVIARASDDTFEPEGMLAFLDKYGG